MARAAIRLKVQLFDIVCHDEADGIGDAEPYLWPVFFKIDGDSFAVDAVGLIGFPKIIPTNGNHGNLGDTDVGEGDRVLVPETLGMQTMLLKPIPVNDPILRMEIGDDLPGIAGVIVVLMEEDGWPDDIATTGYNALVEAVRLGVAKAAASFQNATAKPTPEQIDEQIALVKTSTGKMVKGAILEYMSGSQTAWYGTLGNNDDQIGTEAWTVNQDDFAKDSLITFERRWNDDESDGNGDWSITVEFTNLDGPPSVNVTGRLLFYRDTTQDGTGDVNTPSVIGLGGWDAFKFLFSGGNGIIYAVDQAGQLLFYHDTTQDGTGDVNTPSVIGLGGWDAFKFLFSGGNGIIYAVDQAGQLLFYHDTTQDGTGDVNTPSVIGLGGWDAFKFLFSGGNGIIYAVDQAGQLLFCRDTTQDGTGDVNTPSVIGLGGWDAFKFLFSGGNGIIYAVDQAGRLLFYRDTTQDGTGDVNTPSVIGQGGWDAFKFLFSGGNGIIYAVVA